MKTDKELGALRVMEALSTVDEELLERCEESGAHAAGGNKKASIHRFVQRYAKACAACLCLAVLGAAYLCMSRMHMVGNKSGEQNTDMNGGGAADYSGQMAGKTENAAPMDMAENGKAEAPVAEAAEGFSLNYEQPAESEPEWLDVDSLMAQQYDSARQETTDGGEAKEHPMSSRFESAQEPQASDSDPEKYIQAKDILAAGADVPESYSPVWTENENANPERQDSLLYEWSDGEHNLWLRITQTELTADMRINAEFPVYTVQEEWRDLIPDAGADGYVQFALLYENGVLVEYRGVLEREEIIRLMESLAR